MFGQQSLFGTGQTNQQQQQTNQTNQNQTQPQTSGFSLFNKPATTGTTTSNLNLNQNQTQPNFMLNPQQSGQNASLFGQQPNQAQTNQASFQPANQTQNQPFNRSGAQALPNPNLNLAEGSKQNLDFFHSKLSTQKVSKESQDEIYSKIVKQYSDFSKSNNLKGHLQLESLDLNLDMLDQMILPDYLKFKKNLFQLVALTENNKRDIAKSTANIDKAQAFLSDQGINIAKLDKDVNEIKNYLISNYDFISQDLNKINISAGDKSIIDDRTKMHLITSTNALWAKTNDNIIYTNNKARLRTSKDLHYYSKIAKQQFAELEGFAALGGSSREFVSVSSNAQSANKFVPGGSTNKFLFGGRSAANRNPCASRLEASAAALNRVKRASGNFTPLKSMSCISAAKGGFAFGNAGSALNNVNVNRFNNKPVNNLSSNFVGGGNYSGDAFDFANAAKQKSFSTLDYIDNLRMVNHKNVGIGAADETQAFQFANYFENLKRYFFYKLKGEVIVENQPLLITNSDLDAFHAQAQDERRKNNILPMSICVNKLTHYFEYTKDFSRKSSFSLIFSQIKCLNKSWKNSNLTVENVLANTIKFYESEYLKRIISFCDMPPSAIGKSSAIAEGDIYALEFDFKYNCVEKFATNFIFQNFSNVKSPLQQQQQHFPMPFGNNNLQYMNPNYANNNYSSSSYSKNDLEKMKKWAIIFTFLRAGLVKDCFIYLSNLIKLGYEEDLSSQNYGGFGINADFNAAGGADVFRDQDLELFFSLMKQVYSEVEIDENAYSLLSEKIKLKNLKDAEPFKFCCFNLILKINQPVNENVFLNFEDYVWYHLNLIHKKANFLGLLQKTSIKLNYLSLDEFQEYILQNDPSIFNSKNNPDFYLDYAKSLFSLLLFEEGIKVLLEVNKHVIDAFNIGFVLSELNLLRNFSEEDLYKELVEFRSLQGLDVLKSQFNLFANKIVDKKKLFELLLYVKFLFLDEEPQKTLDLFTMNINRLGNFAFLLNGSNAFIEIEDVIFRFKFLFNTIPYFNLFCVFIFRFFFIKS